MADKIDAASTKQAADVAEIVERLRKHGPLLKASVFIDAGLAFEDAADLIERLSASTVGREPTEAMVEAFFQCNAAAETVFADPADLWRAMYDAALADTSGDGGEGGQDGQG